MCVCVTVTAQAVADIVKEDKLKHGVLDKKEVTSRYFGIVVVITGMKLNSHEGRQRDI